MSKHDDNAQSADITQQLTPLINDDAFLTELSLGKDPSQGEDPLAKLFLELRDDVEAPMPPAPVVEGADQEPDVISLDAVRRRRVNPWMSGLVGVAAGVVLVAASGAMIFRAGPESPLYGAHTALFGEDNPSVVELAGTLQEMEERAASGDITGAREMLDHARKQLDQAAPEDVQKAANAPATTARPASPRTVTVTTSIMADNDNDGFPDDPTTVTVQPAPVTVATTATVVVTEYAGAAAGNPQPAPQATAEPEDPLDTAGDYAADPQAGTGTGGTRVGAAMADEDDYATEIGSDLHGTLKDADGDGLPDPVIE